VGERYRKKVGLRRGKKKKEKGGARFLPCQKKINGRLTRKRKLRTKFNQRIQEKRRVWAWGTRAPENETKYYLLDHLKKLEKKKTLDRERGINPYAKKRRRSQKRDLVIEQG